MFRTKIRSGSGFILRVNTTPWTWLPRRRNPISMPSFPRQIGRVGGEIWLAGSIGLVCGEVGSVIREGGKVIRHDVK